MAVVFEMQAMWRGQGRCAAVCGAVLPLVLLGGAAAAHAQSETVSVGPAAVEERDRAAFAPLTLAVENAPAGLRAPAPQPVCYPFRLSYGDSRSTATRADVWIVEGRDLGRSIDVGWFHVTLDADGAGSGGLASFTNVVVAGDDEDEPDEAFVVEVGGGVACPPGGAVPRLPFGMQAGTGVVRIVDDDERVPGVPSGTSLRVSEPEAAEAVVALVLPLNGEAGEQYCYPYELAAGRGTAAVGAAGDVDYAVAGGPGRFVAAVGNRVAISRDLKVFGDAVVEGDETFYLDVYSGVPGAACAVSAGAAPIAQVEVIITDNDERAPGVRAGSLEVAETDADFVAVLELVLEGEAAGAVCYAFGVVDGRGTADRPADFRGGPGMFVAAAGDTVARSRDVTIVGDDLVEEDESFFLEVHAGVEGSACSVAPGALPVASVQVTIVDDDRDTSGISPTAFTVAETDEDAPAALALTFARAADADYCFAFELAYRRGTAGGDDAWVGAGRSSQGFFVLDAGATALVVRDVVVAGDDLVEETETLHIDVYERRRGVRSCSPDGPVAVVLTVTIEDDDEDTSEISPTLFTVAETDEDVAAALALTFGTPSDASYCFAFELAYGRSTAGAEDAWVGAGKSSRGYFVLSAGLTRIVVRDLIVAGDDVAEETETLYIDVYERRRGVSSCSPGGTVVTVLTVRIEDDDRDGPGVEGGAFEVVETDVDAVAALQLALGVAAEDARCYPYRVAYGRSTATRADAWLVESAGNPRVVDHGRFVVRAGLSTAVSLNLMVAGDDVIEEPETLYLDLYAPGGAGETACAPAGMPTGTFVVTIVDDDSVAPIESIEVDGAVDGLVREGDSGERVSVYVIVRFERRLAEPVTLRYGSVADGLARGTALKQDVETFAARSSAVAAGQVAARLHVATVVGDDRVEAVEDFGVWVAVDDYGAETKTWLRVRIGNDDVPGDEILSVVLEGVEGSAIVEGNPDMGYGGGDCQREWKCVPIMLELTGGRQSEDITYEVRIVPGSARPGEDYRFRDGVRVTLQEGHLRAVVDPLRIEVRRDWFVEPAREDFYLVVQMLAEGETPLVSWFERLEIIDDDRIGGEGGALWFGGAHEIDACPGGSGRFRLMEPPEGGVGSAVLDLVVAQRPAGAADGDAAACAVGAGKAVTEYRYELWSGSASVGADVLAVSRTGGRVRFVAGRGAVALAVVGDGALEPAEGLSLVLLDGGGPVARLTVVIEDRESAVEAAASRTAEAVRMGRVLAAEVSDVLAERFSCAASAACAALGADPEARIWPAGRPGPRTSLSALLQRAHPGGGAAGRGGLRGGGGPADPAALGGVGSHGPFASSAGRLALAGRALDGVRWQGDPGRWLGAVNTARGDHRPARWTAWTRASYAEAEDVGNTARRLRTSMLALTGGLDRQVGRGRLGVLYTHAAAAAETDAHGWAQETVDDAGRRPSAWRVVAPYAGWIPHRRFRLWVSPGWVSGGEGGAGLRAAMRMLVGGASVSLVASDELSLDVEGDVFQVGVERQAAPAEMAFHAGNEPFSGRARRARLAGRMGFPLGDPSATASRMTVRLGRRWDAGTDIDWVWGPIRPGVSGGGAGQVAATDLLVDFRYRRLRSPLSLVVTAGVQTGGEQPQVDGEHVRWSSRRRVGAGAGLQWGAAGSGPGWSGSVRPSYGHVSLAMPGWWSAAVPAMSGFGSFETAPLLDGEVGYRFGDGGSVALSARQAFGGGRAGVGGIGALVRYGRGW